eukprot:TRINITY_DN4124_c0_g1_i3.p2 TRINITY_DN4124_c0_g1~~TRINITY_DN4124_c0_g1_i3.p2  ORF type:complete len:399 (-),score=77.00 TRINITY_DN4124_c0_g1_i3:1982-3178(-)
MLKIQALYRMRKQRKAYKKLISSKKGFEILVKCIPKKQFSFKKESIANINQEAKNKKKKLAREQSAQTLLRYIDIYVKRYFILKFKEWYSVKQRVFIQQQENQKQEIFVPQKAKDENILKEQEQQGKQKAKIGEEEQKALLESQLVIEEDDGPIFQDLLQNSNDNSSQPTDFSSKNENQEPYNLQFVESNQTPQQQCQSQQQPQLQQQDQLQTEQQQQQQQQQPHQQQPHQPTDTKQLAQEYGKEPNIQSKDILSENIKSSTKADDFTTLGLPIWFDYLVQPQLHQQSQDTMTKLQAFMDQQDKMKQMRKQQDGLILSQSSLFSFSEYCFSSLVNHQISDYTDDYIKLVSDSDYFGYLENVIIKGKNWSKQMTMQKFMAFSEKDLSEPLTNCSKKKGS